MTEQQELFERRVKARSLAYLFTAGALLGLLTLAFPHGDQVNDLALVCLAGAAIAIGAVFYVRAGGGTEWELHAAVAAGTVILLLANYWVSGSVPYTILFTWTIIYAFYFFSLPAALAHLGLLAVGYAVLLVIQEPPSAVVRWLLAIGTPAVVGVLVSRMLDQLRLEAGRARARAGELRATEGRTRLILESAPEPFVSIDRDGVVVAWNAAAERTFGWTAAEAVGRPLRGLVLPPEAREGHDQRRRDLVENPDAVVVSRSELELQRRDGSRFPGEVTVSRVQVGDDVLLSSFIRDLSERERREEQRDALVREQAARAEAERVAEMVSGMQVLVDAALAHRTLSEMLAELVPRVQAVLGADAVGLFLAEEGELLTLAASTAGTPPSDGPIASFGDGFAGRVAALRQPMLDQDPDRESLIDPGMRELDVSSLIGVPLEARGEVTGVIVVCAEAPHTFSEEDLGMLRLAADRVALAIDHARVYEREHRIAETLQRSLLPERLPQLPGMSVSARYLPAKSEAEVGGDWYDVISIPGGGVGLVMGDVAGKGLAAASMVGRLRSALRAYALEGHDPATVVERLNRVVFTELEESQMATLVYLVLDPAEGTIRWVNAGHLPPVVVSDQGEARFLEGEHSVPLGVMPFPSFEELRADAEPASTIVLYTDGLVERPGDHLDNGFARLAGAMADAPRAPEAFCDHLLSRLVPAGAASDDVALLALQHNAIADEFSIELPTAPEALAAMRGLLRRWLREAESSDQEIAEITTAAGEAATNAIEHAGATGDTPFELDGRLSNREVDITVRDYGAWRAPREGDRGRGISLMRALMDDVEVTPSPEGTTVRMRRRLNGTPG